MRRRGSGILCHITSLPSPFGIGDLGPGAYAFADFLAEAKQSYWQILPLNPTSRRYADSPFSTMSSCAGNTAVISPEVLVGEGLLTGQEIANPPRFPDGKVDYQAVSDFKQQLFNRAHARFREGEADNREYQRFCSGEAGWLEEHALFTALYYHLGEIPLAEWPEAIRNRDSDELHGLRESLAEQIGREKFLQYTFYKQWQALRNYCNLKGIHIIGDFPMFMNYDSVDIWVDPGYFKVSGDKRPYVVAGSPPDDFSAVGQIFNCALYNWDAMKGDGFSWWLRRFHYLLKLYDFVRIDHFRGLIAYWEVPAGEETAVNGNWQPAMASDFLNALLRRYPTLPVIAEDLGAITPDIREVMAVYGIPGIKILLLGFEKVDFESVYLPHNHVQNCVVYTGTHDTNTVMGWYHQGDREDREVVSRYLGCDIAIEPNWTFIRCAMMSVANTAILQMQDVLGTGEESRMNYPGKAEGNWQWRFPAGEYRSHALRLAEMTELYGRAR
ncbi:MAG TPA: 4-alpha-glucanotransferase [Geomonas sp.]|nr:4-alpha-glucanotransferase [Geomonas sp.]